MINIQRDFHGALAFERSSKCYQLGKDFLVPVSPPVHFEGVENRNFFGQAISDQDLFERAIL